MDEANDREAIGANGGPPLIRGGDGWVAVHRSIRDHWIVGFGQPVKPMDPDVGALSRAEAWIDLIMECRYEAGTVNNGGRKMVLEPGQLLGAISWLAKRWNWSPQTVRTFLDKLENDGMIERRSPVEKDENNKHNGKQANVVTICNYSNYQITASDEAQPQQQAANKQLTSKQQASNNNTKDNKETKEQGNKKENPQTPKGDLLNIDIPKPTFKSVAREAFVQWQEFSKAHGLSCPRDTTFDTFADAMVSRMREHASEPSRSAMLDVWHLALCHVAKSKFLRGMSNADWKTDLGSILRAKNFAKLISGGYGNGACALDARWALASGLKPIPQIDPAERERRRQDEEAKLAAEGWEIRRAVGPEAPPGFEVKT